jgi:hypothetical protein
LIQKRAVCHGTALGDKLDVKFLCGTISADAKLSIASEKNWNGDKSDLFGTTSIPYHL